MPNFARRLALAAAIAIVPLSTPAFAKSDKGTVVRLPASSLKDPAARLCMPRTMLPKAAAAGLPNTVCQTRDEWATAGVTVEAR